MNEFENDSSRMWESLKEILPSDNVGEVSTIHSDSGRSYSCSQQIAEIFNKHFTSIGKHLAKSFRGVGNWSTSFISDVKFKPQPVTVASVANQLAQLKTNKATGLDSISARMLRDSSDVIAPPLTYLINMSFRTGVFPDMWKCAKVMALFKKGDKHDRDNYRPISILPSVSKVIERLVHLQLYGHLTQNKLLFDNQFGFRQRRSTATALCRFTDDLLTNMDEGKFRGVVYLDLKKAFDTVDHKILILKLKAAGVSRLTLNWFHSYLTSRCQRTAVGRSLSGTRRASGCWCAPGIHFRYLIYYF